MGIFSSIIGGLLGGSDDSGCDWYCDDCNAFMNSRSGFSTSGGSWTCSECGSDNDVTDDNIRWDDEEYEYDSYYEVDDEPACAAGCGGYPEACSGCNLGGNSD